jgi:chromate transporter
MQDLFYWVGASVIGIIVLSSYKLTIKSVGKISVAEIQKKWLLWVLYGVCCTVTLLTKKELVWLFMAAGLVYMFIQAPPKWARVTANTCSLLLLLAFTIQWTGSETDLWTIAWFFAKAGAFVFGSGLAIVPFLHSGVVVEFGWLTETEFLDAVAVAMITPGPVVITVGFIGYLQAGIAGACIAALATFLPCYLLTVIPAPYFSRIAKDKSIKAFVEGITAAVIGALTGAVAIIAMNTFTKNQTAGFDFLSAGIAIASLLCLLHVKKIQEPVLILVAASLGMLFHYIG